MNTPLKHFLFLAALLLAGSTAQAATITVDGTTCTLADAITAANTDTATGGCTSGSGEDSIVLQQDVLLTAALPEIASTITIEGEGHKIDGQKKYAVGSVLHVLSTGNLTVNEATVTGGDSSRGGGVYNDGGIVTLTNSTISGNEAWPYGGGGIYNYYYGTVTLTNSTVSGNLSDISGRVNFGGGICNYGTATLINSRVSGNKAYYGGGIDNIGGTVTLINSTLSGNAVAYDGGGIANSGTCTLTNSTVSGNSADYGGGICNGFATAVARSRCAAPLSAATVRSA
jgi:hypothetical protein